MSYHEDCLFAAVSVLVRHGPIKQRLIRAYEDHLENLEDDELPLPVQESFAGLRRMMHGVAPANGEGPICASVRKMSKDEADRCAQLIVDICLDVARLGESVAAPLPLPAADGPVVPPFLVKSAYGSTTG